MVWSQKRMDRDKEDNLSDEMRTLTRVCEMANMLFKGVRFTVDAPENHPARRVMLNHPARRDLLDHPIGRVMLNHLVRTIKDSPRYPRIAEENQGHLWTVKYSLRYPRIS